MSTEEIINPKCSLCNTPFSLERNPPLLLHCGHTYCQECIENKLTDKKCTKCYAIIRSEWPLPKNFALINIDRDVKYKPSAWSEDLSRYENSAKYFCSRLNPLEARFDDIINIAFGIINSTRTSLAEVKIMLGLMTAISRYQMNSRPKGITCSTPYDVVTTLIKKRNEFQEQSPIIGIKYFSVSNALRSLPENQAKYWMLKAIHRHDEAYVGAEVDGNLKWGKVKKLHDIVLVGALTSVNIPHIYTVLLKLNWFDKLTKSSRMVYFELEVNQKDVPVLKKRAPNFPKTFIVSIQLLPNFMEIPLAKQLYYTCTGEKGISYVNSEVSVNKNNNTIFVDNKKMIYPLLNVPDNSEEWLAVPGCVLGSPLSYGYTNFSITRSRIRTKETLLGYIYSDLAYFKYNLTFVVKSCGTIVFPNEMHCKPDITNYPTVDAGFDFPHKSVAEIFQIKNCESKSEESSSSSKPKNSEKKAKASKR